MGSPPAAREPSPMRSPPKRLAAAVHGRCTRGARATIGDEMLRLRTMLLVCCLFATSAFAADDDLVGVGASAETSSKASATTAPSDRRPWRRRAATGPGVATTRAARERNPKNIVDILAQTDTADDW